MHHYADRMQNDKQTGQPKSIEGKGAPVRILFIWVRDSGVEGFQGIGWAIVQRMVLATNITNR